MVEREVFCLGKQTPPEQPGRSGGMASACHRARDTEGIVVGLHLWKEMGPIIESIPTATRGYS